MYIFFFILPVDLPDTAFKSKMANVLKLVTDDHKDRQKNWFGGRGELNWYSRSFLFNTHKALKQLPKSQHRQTSMWLCSMIQKEKPTQISETTIYAVAIHFLPLQLGAAGRCQLLKTSVKVLHFSQSCILPLIVSPGAAGGSKYLHTSSWILLYCSWSATICSSWEQRAGKKEQYFSITTNNLFFTDRWWTSTVHSVQISI